MILLHTAVQYCTVMHWPVYLIALQYIVHAVLQCYGWY